MITIYHNPRCTKSRECIAFAENAKYQFEIIKYLEQPFTNSELKELIKKLNINPIELVRTKEKIWIENFKNKNLSEKEIIEALVDNPILIERPIAVKGNKAVIARPFSRINELF